MRILLPITIFLAFLLSACSGADRHTLKQADAIMEQHPDSTLSVSTTKGHYITPITPITQYSTKITVILI